MKQKKKDYQLAVNSFLQKYDEAEPEKTKRRKQTSITSPTGQARYEAFYDRIIAADQRSAGKR